MNLAARIIKNSVFLSLTTMVDRLAEMVLFFFMARSLGPSFVGDYKTVAMYLAIFQNLANYGLTQLVMREVATLRNREEAGSLLIHYGFASLWIALGLMVVMSVVGRLISYSPAITLGIYVVSLALLPSSWRRVAEATISGMESMEYIALVSFLGSAFRVAISMPLLLRGYGLTAVLIVLVITQFAVIPAYLLVINRFLVPVRFRFDTSYVRRIASPRHLSSLLHSDQARQIGIFLLMGMLLVGVGNQLDVVMIRKMTSAEQAGLYTAAYTFVQTIVLLRPAILQAVTPNMASFFETSLPKFQTLTEELLQSFMVVLLPIPLITVALAKPLIPLLLGSSFSDSAITLQVLIWLILPSFIYATLSRALVAGNQERINTRIAGLCMATNVLLNLAFISLWGATGAALSSVLSMSLAAICSYFAVRTTLFNLDLAKILGRPVLCALGASLLAYILRDVTLWILIPIFLACYSALLLLAKALPPRLTALISQMIQARVIRWQRN